MDVKKELTQIRAMLHIAPQLQIQNTALAAKHPVVTHTQGRLHLCRGQLRTSDKLFCAPPSRHLWLMDRADMEKLVDIGTAAEFDGTTELSAKDLQSSINQKMKWVGLMNAVKAQIAICVF